MASSPLLRGPPTQGRALVVYPYRFWAALVLPLISSSSRVSAVEGAPPSSVAELTPPRAREIRASCWGRQGKGGAVCGVREGMRRLGRLGQACERLMVLAAPLHTPLRAHVVLLDQL